MGVISSGLRLPGRARPPTGGEAKAEQRGSTSFSCSRGLHRTLWTVDQRRGGGGRKTAPLGLRFFRSKPESQCVQSLKPQETCPSQLQSEAKDTVKSPLAGQFPYPFLSWLHSIIELHQHLFRGPDLNHPGGQWLSGGISMLPDSLKDIWARLVCVSLPCQHLVGWWLALHDRAWKSPDSRDPATVYFMWSANHWFS